METMHAAGRRRLPPVPRPAAERRITTQLTVDGPHTTADAPERTEPAPSLPDDAGQNRTELIDARQVAAELDEAAGPPRPRTATDAAEDASPDDRTDARGVGDTESDAGDGADPTDLGDTDQAETARLELPDLAADPVDDAVPEALSSAGAGAVAPGPEVAGPTDDTHVDDQDPAQQFVTRLRASAADFAGAAGAETAVVREAVPPARHRRARCRLVLRYADGAEADVTLLGPAGAPGRPSRHGFDRQILRWLGAGLVRDAEWIADDPDAPDGMAVDLTAWVAAG